MLGYDILFWHPLMRGKKVSYLMPEAYGGCTDVAEAWAAGVLDCAVSTEDIERSVA